MSRLPFTLFLLCACALVISTAQNQMATAPSFNDIEFTTSVLNNPTEAPIESLDFLLKTESEFTTLPHSTTESEFTTFPASITESEFTTLPLSTTESEPSSTTPAPSPLAPIYFNISHEGAYCIMVKGDFSFNITYDTDDNLTRQAIVTVPEPGDDGIKVDGNCSEPLMQWISISWGSTIPKSRLSFTFEKMNSSFQWNIASISSLIAFDSTFVNASDPESVVESTFKYYMNPFDVPFNQSYNCHTTRQSKNETSFIGNETYPWPLHFESQEVLIQAFNFIPKASQFSKSVFCKIDKETDVLPTIVGCILIFVIIFVISSYIFGRRNRSTYEPI